MKFRTTFVSNSSSESFICDTKMKLEDVKKALIVLLDFYNMFFTEELSFNEVFQDPIICDKEKEDFYKDFFGENTYIPECIGKVVIESYQDNSVPSELFDLIESKFEAFRLHLG